MNLKEKISKYGKWSLITGGSDGIGRDFSRQLASLGQNIIIVGRNENKLKNIKTEIEKQYKVEIITLSLDLSSYDQVNKLLIQTENIDIGLVILAAGYGSIGKFHTLDLNSELQMVDLNCRAIVHLSHAFTNRMKSKSKGALILFGSLVGFQGVAWTANYSASKAFVQSFAEGIRAELKSANIDVLSVAPGPVSSGFGERAGMKMGQAQSTKGIAKASLKALGNQTTIRPGFLSKFLGYSLIILPRNIRSFILKQIMSGMMESKK
jgi:uncharacterized protein